MMATRIESGQMQLARPGNVPMVQAQMPTVQPIGFQVAAQEQGRMAQLIQRMSESLFKEAGQMAEQEGFRYAAENPLTDEEIALARDGAITKPTGRIFDDAFRKARSLQLASHFEAEGINNMSRLLPDIEAGRITSEQVILKLREMNSGFTASLAKLDPQAAMKFNASMAASGNTIVRKALETEIRQDRERNRIKFDVLYDRVSGLLQTTLEQNPQQANELIEMYKGQISTSALTLGDAVMQKEYSDRFLRDIRAAKIAVLTKELTANPDNLDNPMLILNAISVGNIGGKLTPVLQDLMTNDFEAVRTVQANFLAAVSQRQTLQEQQRKERDRQATAEIGGLYASALERSESDPARGAIVSRILEISRENPGVVPWSMVGTLFKPKQVENQSVEFSARLLIDNGTITDPNQIWSLTEGQNPITGGQALQLLSYFNSSNRREETDKNTMLSRLAGVATVPGQVVLIDPKSAEFQRRQELVKQAAFFEAESSEKGERLTMPQLESKLTDWLNTKRNTALVQELRSQLQVYEKQAGGTITESNLEALERSGKLSKPKLNTVRQILQQIREAEGK
jgi:hypothetical protein